MEKLTKINPENTLDSFGSTNEFIYEGEFSATSATTASIEMPYGCKGGTFVIIPASGTCSLEYSCDTKAKLIAGTAAWQTYVDATAQTIFAVTTSDAFNSQVKALRMTAIGGTSRIVINAVYGG